MFWEGGRVPWCGEWGRDLVGSVLLSEAALRANACSASGLLRLPGGTPPAVQVLINRTQSLYLYPVTGLSERADKGEPLILPHPSVSFGQKDEGVMQSEGTVCVPCGRTARPGRDAGGAGRALRGRAWTWIITPGCKGKLESFAGGLWARISWLQLQREYSLILNGAKRVCTGGKEEDKSHSSQLHL